MGQAPWKLSLFQSVASSATGSRRTCVQNFGWRTSFRLSHHPNPTVQGAPVGRIGVTAETVRDPRDAEIQRLRGELAEAQEALKRERLRGDAFEGGPGARAAIDGIPGFVAILAADGSVEVVNRQIMTYAGRTLDELKDWGAIGLVHEDDAA